ncbi:MAG: family 78 glycoside hydrolase catalytic domain, partial [Chitinophagaceae bacterium]
TENPDRPAQYFRKTFFSKGKIRSATAFLTAHGLYEAQLNGKRIGEDYLSPGWTSYSHRLPYQTYDVTSLLQEGENAVGMIVGNGWYRGFLAWDNHKDIYGKKLGVFAQLEITYADGRKEFIVSDDTWKVGEGSIRFAEIYHGETIDARKEPVGWSSPGFADQGWSPVRKVDSSIQTLIATYNEPIQKQERFSPVKILQTPSGEQVIDFGQNLVGWVRVKVQGRSGDQIVVKHAEVLDKQGNFYTENLRAAKATATYILKGEGLETFEPHFTFYGFRYIKVEGYPGALKPENFEAVTLYSHMPATGTFSCSNPLLNQLQHNIQWGQRGNFLDVPTDCPQRDERLGWTGDAQAFSRTAAFNFGVYNFFAKWLKDVAADQLPDGRVPFVVPNVLGDGASGSTGWADVANIIPWNLYLSYGDPKVLADQYASMKAWVEYMQAKSQQDLWNTGFHFGDWLFYRPFDDNDGRSAVTDKYLIAQCFWAHSTQLLIKAAKVLGKQEDADNYSQMLQRIKKAFVKEYLTPNGRLV